MKIDLNGVTAGSPTRSNPPRRGAASFNFVIQLQMCTRIIKLETEIEVKSLISRLRQVGPGQIKLETGGWFGGAG